MNKKKIIWGAISAILLVLLIVAGASAYIYQQMVRAPFIDKDQWVYIYPDKHVEGMPTSNFWFETAASNEQLFEKLEAGKLTGAYRLEKGWSAMRVARCIARRQQTAVRLTFNGTRTLGDLACKMSHCIAADSSEIMQAILSPNFLKKCETDTANVGGFLLPDTYQVYWDISPEKLTDRLKKEYDKFWNEERLTRCKELNISPREAVILCSIAEEETANRRERGVVARLYWNRLQKGMLLQADPTVKYALGDFALKRILLKHLEVESPYNTYKNPGLPPGPIRIVEKATIDALLNSQPHPYLYMCAKEDFSGLHNFAQTLAEHQRNAQKYHAALNQRKIK
ncbi:MAG: endolytic transglycosylase MltG [Bacteroidales bacterium]|nr:endolytic transglycosylase MltG [Bacteroidales bacterium]